MKVGDLVLSSITSDHYDISCSKRRASEIGIIVGVKSNGHCKVQFEHGVFLIVPMWLEVIS